MIDQGTSGGSVQELDASIPRHVAIIMDGNGRWAGERGLPRSAGHSAGTENVRGIVEACVECGVQVLTLYAFSTENWRRPYEEIDALFAILSDVIDRETEELGRKGVSIRHIGSLDEVPVSLADRIRRAVDVTRFNDRLVLNVAFNYGGRGEIVRAIQRMLDEGLEPHAITADAISAHLDTAGLPDPDLIIRTAGEMRLSNFLLWQSAYSEYWSTDVYWPEFDRVCFKEALAQFSARQRRYGGVKPGHANGAKTA